MAHAYLDLPKLLSLEDRNQFNTKQNKTNDGQVTFFSHGLAANDNDN